MPDSGERFLSAVERLGLIPDQDLERVREAQQAQKLDSARVAQELLKRTDLTPKQVAQIRRALREEGLVQGPPGSSARLIPNPPAIPTAAQESVEDSARAETQERVEDPTKAVTLEMVRPPSNSTEPILGEVVGGRFRLVKEIGRGAQGIVFRARDKSFDRDVAVKVLRWDAPGQARKRFEREARIVSQLGHPGIITVFDAGATNQGLPYFAMELIEGPSLQSVLDDEGPLSPERAVRVVEALAMAMHHAHEAGLVHRDLKPDNVLILGDPSTPRGDSVRVADFGLVTLSEGTRLTMTRGVVGTPVYMAPEQAEAQRIDRRADVYSMGAILYECLTGRPPFEGVTPLEIFRRIVREQPARPRSLRPEIPVSLEEVCLRTLEKEPRARYPTAAAFARDLRRAIEGYDLAPRRVDPFPWRKLVRAVRRHPGLVGWLLGLVTGVALGAVLVTPTRYGAETSSSQTKPLQGTERRAAHRKKLLDLARAERSRGLEQAAIDWCRTLDERELQRDPQARQDVVRARVLETLAWVGLRELGQARAALGQALLILPRDPGSIWVWARSFAARAG